MKTFLVVIYVIVAVLLTILTLLQAKEDGGASETITGGDSFYDKNKGRTPEGKLKRFTIILAIIFVVLAIALGIIY